MSYVPDEGELIEVDWESGEGETAVRRLVLVLSPKAFQEGLGLAWVAPVTFVRSRHLFHFDLPTSVKTFGTVKIEQLFALDYAARGARGVECVPPAFLQLCRTAAGRVLGF